MEYEMHSGMLYESEEKISRTEMAEKLINAKETVITVKFETKVDDKHVAEILTRVSQADQQDPQKLKAFAKEMITGKEAEMTCHLLSTEVSGEDLRVLI